MEIDRVRFERSSRAEVNVFAGSHLVGRLKRGRGYPRGKAPYFFYCVSLMAPFTNETASRALFTLQSADLGTRLENAAPKIAEFLNLWKDELVISSMFISIPNKALAEALESTAT